MHATLAESHLRPNRCGAGSHSHGWCGRTEDESEAWGWDPWQAQEFVPVALRGSVPVHFKATAGLRLLPSKRGRTRGHTRTHTYARSPARTCTRNRTRRARSHTHSPRARHACMHARAWQSRSRPRRCWRACATTSARKATRSSASGCTSSTGAPRERIRGKGRRVAADRPTAHGACAAWTRRSTRGSRPTTC